MRLVVYSGTALMLDLGLSDLRPLPGIAADPARWAAVSARMHRGVYLRSEGTMVTVLAPQTISGKLLAQSREVVTHLDKFYCEVAAAYYTRPDLRDEFLVNPLIEPLLALEVDQPIATPLSRLDVVLEPNGKMRVIEINSVGVCLFHLRSLLYAIRALDRGGLSEDARILDHLAHDMVTAFVSYATARLGSTPKRLVIGALGPTNHLRAGHLLFRAAFERYGCDYVFGAPEHLEVNDREIRLRGRKIDVLWADFLFYLAYQCARYQETKWPTKMPDFGQAPAQTAALLANPRFLDHLRSGRVVNLSPARSYLALPKSLLSWVHRDDRPIDPAARAFLADHVAHTYSARDRIDGLITMDDAIRDRSGLLIKPCQYGGSHGVQVGRLTDTEWWQLRVAEIWTDPSWVLQEFREPVRAATGEWISFGLQNFAGSLGGVYIRTSTSLMISARDAAFIPAVPLAQH
jgi:hypothetical protein